MIPVLMFPGFDPVIVHFGPFAIRWYALAYIAGLVLGWRLLRRMVLKPPAVATAVQADDFLTWATLGVVLGGRLGYVLFYQPDFYLHHPAHIFAVWQGGMSFHGGMLGVTIAIVWFCRSQKINFLAFADRIAVCAPIGLGFGRIANFINGELWGRPAPMPAWLEPILGHHRWLPWAMIFPTGGPIPRYPSELFEATLEGLVLFVIMYSLGRREGLRAHTGFLTGAFLAGYACARIFCEFFRQPDPFLGYLWDGATMGQLLSLPLLVAGVWLMARSRGHLLPSHAPAAPDVPGSRDATA